MNVMNLGTEVTIAVVAEPVTRAILDPLNALVNFRL
jgi:hypothetical protein